MRDYYEILEVDKKSTADEIKKAYRKKAQIHHPDKGGDKEQFNRIQEAYETLSDDNKRDHYDRFGDSQKNSFNGFSGFGFDINDVFSTFSNHGPFSAFKNRREKKGPNLRIQLQLTLEEIFHGVNKKVKYKRNVSCDDCSGMGGKQESICNDCSGSGVINISQRTPFGMVTSSAICNKCEGEGKIMKDMCSTCRGQGTKQIEEVFDIPIPRGAQSGMEFLASDKGNFIKGGVYGDLNIVINEIPHQKFRRDGNSIFCEETISIPDAVLGTNIKIKSLNDDQINLEIFSGTESGKVYTIPHKGLPVFSENGRNSHGFGNLYVTIKVEIPKNLTQKQKEAFNSLRKLL